MWIKYNPILGYIKVFNGIMGLCIKFFIYIPGKVPAQVHIVTIASQTFPVVGHNFNGTFFYFF